MDAFTFPQRWAYVPSEDVRYRHSCTAADGTPLYVYAWLEESGYMLTTTQNIRFQEEIVVELATNDFQQLQLHVLNFFAQHGGVGQAFARQ
ncbi:hypothetical protein [Hymenobacter sp. BT491]|uniref:hypothetical protein n=1 Tax=Hymenobacter sp. BT491 TaxID=2766779 RepID=UPI001653B712|nr:hypothetical protein [Hymenobacter sp. BT491]MBC6992400.1 hypothetical protein [Hymenobacter sp. BT491]